MVGCKEQEHSLGDCTEQEQPSKSGGFMPWEWLKVCVCEGDTDRERESVCGSERECV